MPASHTIKRSSPKTPKSYPKKRQTVERKIHFYRAEVGPPDGQPSLPFEASRICQAITALQWSDRATNKAYWESEPGMLYGALVDKPQSPGLADRPRLRFFAIRRNDLPLLELKGQFSPLDIPPDGGLAEAVYVTCFPDNIVGAIYNFHGPRLPRFGAYLSANVRGFPPVQFAPLIRTDALSRLLRLESLTTLRVRMSQEGVQSLGRSNQSMKEMFRMMMEFGSAATLQVVLKAPDSRSSLSQRAVNFAKSLIRPDNNTILEQEGLEELTVRGRDPMTGRMATFDLLNEHFVTSRQIITQNNRSRALDELSAYTAIEAAYAELVTELSTANTVHIWRE